MPERKRVLFVDDDPNVLNGLRRMLYRMRDEWDMEFVESGQEAISVLAEQPFDVVVSDMRMPGMNGAELLEHIQTKYPHVVRLILSGFSDQELVLRSVGPAHQFLAKPCDADTLTESVRRSCALREFLSSQNVSHVIGKIKSIPVLPSIYTELLEALSSESATLADVGGIIAKDTGMSAKMLQLVNSAFFGLRQQIDDPSRAVMFLGLDTVKSLVLSASVFSSFDTATVAEFSIDALQRHSLGVAALARHLADEAGIDGPGQEDAFCAGMMHDVGKLILIANFPDDVRRIVAQVEKENVSTVEAERTVLETDHGQLGGYLLGLWGLPDPIVEAVTLHTCPSLSPNKVLGPLTFVYLANLLEHELSNPDGVTTQEFDVAYLQGLGLDGKLPEYRQLAESFFYQAAESGVVS